MSLKTIKFGILGCGIAAQFHAKAIERISGAELLGVADQKYENACAFAKAHQTTAFESFEAMLDSEVDAVCICTPSGFHAKQALQALSAKKHVALEKPMAFTAAEADELIAASNQSGCLLTVVLQNRFSEDVEAVRKMVADGTLGQLAFCDLYMKYWRSPEYYANNPWRGTLALDGGGALINQGIHGVDLMYYLVGNAKVVAGRCKTVLHDIEAEDAAVAMLEFDNGALGVIEASTCAYPGFERRLEIIGTKGSVMMKENKIETLIIDGKPVERKNADVKSGASSPTGIDIRNHAIQLENFVAAIQGDAPLAVDATEGRAAVKIVEDFYRLARGSK